MIKTTMRQGWKRIWPGSHTRKVKAVAKYQKIDDINPRDLLEMHAIFLKYYDNADFNTFTSDMAKKDGAVVCRDGQTGRIMGFSTVMRLKVPKHGGRQVIGLFSGDTIMERELWGSNVLHKAFLRLAVREKLRYLGRPTYWFLISKGYKTYLLLANNAANYFPRCDKPEDPRLRDIVAAYCRMLYPNNFRDDSMVLEFGTGAQHLKADVTPITDEMRRRSPKIRFFETRNPGWQRGNELPCVGEITLPEIIRAGVKHLRRRR